MSGLPYMGRLDWIHCEPCRVPVRGTVEIDEQLKIHLEGGKREKRKEFRVTIDGALQGSGQREPDGSEQYAGFLDTRAVPYGRQTLAAIAVLGYNGNITLHTFNYSINIEVARLFIPSGLQSTYSDDGAVRS